MRGRPGPPDRERRRDEAIAGCRGFDVVVSGRGLIGKVAEVQTDELDRPVRLIVSNGRLFRRRTFIAVGLVGRVVAEQRLVLIDRAPP